MIETRELKIPKTTLVEKILFGILIVGFIAFIVCIPFAVSRSNQLHDECIAKGGDPIVTGGKSIYPTCFAKGVIIK